MKQKTSRACLFFPFVSFYLSSLFPVPFFFRSCKNEMMTKIWTNQTFSPSSALALSNSVSMTKKKLTEK